MMNPASMQALVEAQEEGQKASAPVPQQQAEKWPGDTEDPPSSDPDYEKIQSGVFDMSPEELQVLKEMINAAEERLKKANPDPGGTITL